MRHGGWPFAARASASAVLAALLLAGCGGTGGTDGTQGGGMDEASATRQLTDDGDKVDAAVASLQTVLGGVLAGPLTVGTVRWADCGMAISGSTRAEAVLQFPSPATGPDAAPEQVARRVADAVGAEGWTAAKVEGPLVTAERDGLRLRVSVGASFTEVGVAGGCVDASRTVGRSFTSRAPRTLP